MQLLERIEKEFGVRLEYDQVNDQIVGEGRDKAVEQALERVVRDSEEHRAVTAALRKRQGLEPEPVIRRSVSARPVPDPEVQRQNHVAWASARGAYFTPTEEESRRMFAALRPGDEAIFEFAKSITIRRANGLLEAVDRRGRIVPVPPYSPALKG